MKKVNSFVAALWLGVLAFFAPAEGATVAENAATFQGSGYLRSGVITRPFFETKAFTYELWFKADAAGVLINEVEQFSPGLWDYSFLEVRNDRMLLAGAPGVPTIQGGTIAFGRWYHAAIRYNAASQDLDLFLDGVKVGTSRGNRAVPWEAGRTTFMAVGRGGAYNLATLAGSQYSITEDAGIGTLAFAASGNTYTMSRAGQSEESGTYTGTYNQASRRWDVTLTRSGGGSSTLQMTYTSATRGNFTLRQGGVTTGSGTFSAGSDTAVGFSFRGQVDEVRMWREALSDQTIASQRRIKLPTGDSRLFAMWSLDAVTGNAEGYPTTPDRSGRNNYALLVGSVTMTPSGADLVTDERPTVTTGEAVVGRTRVTVMGTASSTIAGTAYFRYGTDETLNLSTTPVAIGPGTPTSVEAVLGPLASTTTYRYALVASNASGETMGAVRTFVSPDLRPIAVTGAAEDSPGTTTVVNGSATTEVAGSAYFIWGETELNNTTPAVTLPAGTAEVEATLSGLVGGRTYRYALVVVNEYGIATGTTRTFTKIPAETVARMAATFNGSGYLRSKQITRPFFTTKAFTYELWFKADAPGVVITEVHQFTEPAWDYSFLEVRDDRRLAAAVPGVSPILSSPIELGRWYHAAVRYTPGTQDLDLFVDGAKVGSSRGARQTPWEAGHTTFMAFGRAARSGTLGAFHGQMDEIRMWREALPDAEIAANRSVKLGQGDSRMFAMWSVDVIEGSTEGFPTTPDRSPNINPALLVGNVTLTASGAPLVADQLPIAVTGGAVASGTGVTLQGAATSATAGTAFFRWGPAGEMTRTTTPVAIGGGASVSLEAQLQGLEQGATYSYVVVASNAAGTREGEVRTFVAPDLRPVAVTGPFEDSPGGSGVINGTATSPVAATAHFVWGESDLSRTTPAVAVAAGTPVEIEAVLNNLVGGRTYQYALVVSNGFGTRQGETRTFTKLGWAGSAVSLTGTAYLRTQNDQRAFFTDATLTAELWVRPTKAGVVLAEVDRTSPANLDSSIIEILSSGNVVAGFPGVPTILIGAAEMNAWNHIAIRYDKTTQRLDGWVNGVKSAASSSGDRVIGWELGRQFVYTFAKAVVDRIGTGEHLDGEFDEIRLWGTARTDAEIEANFDQKLFGTEAGMVAYYRFDERSTTVADHSRHSNTGVIVNSGGASFVNSAAEVTVDYTPIASTQDGSLRLQFVGVPGREIRLRLTTDFTDWTDGPVAIVDQLGIATFIVTRPSDAPVRFYIGQSL